MAAKTELHCLLEKLFPNPILKTIKWEVSLMEFCVDKILETLKTQIQKVADEGGHTYQEAENATVNYLQKVAGVKAFPDVADKVSEQLKLKKEKGDHQGQEEASGAAAGDVLRVKEMAERITSTYIQVFQRAHPNFSTEEALWRLVLSDMDLKEACLQECGCWNNNQSGPKCKSAHVCAAEFGCKNGLGVEKSSQVSKKNLATAVPMASSSKSQPPMAAAPVAEPPKSGSSKKAKRRAKHANKKKAQTTTGTGEANSTLKPVDVGGACSKSVDESVSHLDEHNAPEKKSDLPITIAPQPETIQASQQEVSSKEMPTEENDANPNPSRVSKPNDLSPEEKDLLLAFLQNRARELEDEIPYWTNWANKKVSDAAIRLNKNKNELQKLRRERDTPENRAELKRIMEEQNEKRICELRVALQKTDAEAKRIEETAERLEKENAELKQKMLSAKREAEEAAARRDLALRSEQNTLKKVEETEDEMKLMEEELRQLKKTHERILNDCFMKGKERDNILREKDRVQKEKEFLLEQAAAIRRQREKNEAAALAKEEKMKRNAEKGLKEYQDKIEKTKEAIAKQNRLNLQANVAALSHKERIKAGESSSSSSSSSKKKADAEERKRNRECVMCLSAETKVLFRPCSHKILCIACNEMHEKQGMKECPTCRTPIQQRIPVRYATN